MKRNLSRRRRVCWTVSGSNLLFVFIRSAILSPERLSLIPKYFVSTPKWWEEQGQAAAADREWAVTANYEPYFGSLLNILDHSNKPDGLRWDDSDKCVRLNNRRSEIVVGLGKATDIEGLLLQADHNDYFVVDFSLNGKNSPIPGLRDLAGLSE